MQSAPIARLLVIALCLCLPQTPVLAVERQSEAEEIEPQPPPLPPRSHELVSAPDEDEESATPIELPSPERAVELAELLEGGHPVSPTQTIVDYDGDAPPGLEGTSHTAVVTSGPSNYLDETGTWKPIKPALDKKLSGWTNTAGPFEISLPERLTPATPVRFSLPEGSLSFLPDSADVMVKAKEKSTTVTYAKILPDTDLVYTSAYEGLREEIVLTKPKASPSVSFSVTGAGLDLQPDGSGGLNVLSGTDQVASIPPPVAWDASGVNGDVSYSLQPLGPSVWRLTVALDPSWYAEASRTFPVTIDPVVTVFSSHDSYINGNTNFGHLSWMTVSDPGMLGGGSESLVSFDLSGFAPDPQIHDARLRVWAQDASSSTPQPVELHDVTSAWDEVTVTSANRPGRGVLRATASGTGANHVPPEQAWYDWDISELAGEWLSGTRANHGVYLRMFSRSSRSFATSEHEPVLGTAPAGAPAPVIDVRPYIVITYNNPPDPPVLAEPVEGPVVESASPSLSINKPVLDPEGDKVYMRYQVAKDPGFNEMVAESGWLER
jgi:hypothetical protein